MCVWCACVCVYVCVVSVRVCSECVCVRACVCSVCLYVYSQIMFMSSRNYNCL